MTAWHGAPRVLAGKPAARPRPVTRIARLNRPTASLLVIATAICVLSAIAGVGTMWTYASSVAPNAAAPRHWPDGTTFERATDRATLVLFLHPQCACSRASIEQVGDAVREARTRPQLEVFVYRVAAESDDWARTDLWRAAEALPGARVRIDEDGRIAAAFGVRVSGTALLFASDGTLQFEGGITASRGFAGPNAGVEALTARLAGHSATVTRAPALGCLLSTPPGE